MKKLSIILSILTLGLSVFGADLKTTDTLVSEFTAIKGKAETQAYVKANYDSIYASYDELLSLKINKELAESDSSKTKVYVDARKALFKLMILSDSKKFISNTEGSKVELALLFPLVIVGTEGKEATKFEKEWINANMESIESVWNFYIALEEKPALSPLKVKLLKAWLVRNRDRLEAVTFVDVSNIVPVLWIKENGLSYADLKLADFTIENIKLTKSIIFSLAKEADDYAYISSMTLGGLGEKELSAYVNYMTEKILALSDSDAYKATKSLENKLLRLNSKQVKALLTKVQSIQDVSYLRIMRENKIK